MNANEINEALIEVARSFVSIMSDNIGYNNLPSVIKDATSVSTVQQNAQNNWYVDITIDLNTAPMAAAFEWGSGIWKQRGTPQRYKIVPKNKQALAFEYNVGRNIPGPVEASIAEPIHFSKKTGKAIFRYVLHPGVAPRPYIVPSIVEVKPIAKKRLGTAFKAMVMTGVPKMTIIEVK